MNVTVQREHGLMFQYRFAHSCRADRNHRVAALGKPIHTIQEADGSKIDQYPAEAGSTSGSGIWPEWIGGTSTGGAYAMISFEYTPGGILKDIKTGK